MTKINFPTLGSVISRFDRLWPNELTDEVKRRIIWKTDKAFAAETGQPEPERYTYKLPQSHKLLIPKECDDAYTYAMLREASRMSEGAKEYYNERYLAAKKDAIATWRMIMKGVNNEEDSLFRREERV